MKESKNRVIISSNVNERNGIGVEIYWNDELVVEIFRIYSKKGQFKLLKRMFLGVSLTIKFNSNEINHEQFMETAFIFEKANGNSH